LRNPIEKELAVGSIKENVLATGVLLRGRSIVKGVIDLAASDSWVLG
jgi:hypothetical protein